MDSIAVVLPAHEPRFDGARRDALLTAHAAQLARVCAKRARVRVFAAREFETHDLLARLAALRPSCVVIEHTPLAYERNGDALAVASWGRAHSCEVVVVAHAEFARTNDPPESAVAAGLAAAGPLFGQASHIVCHETSWARAVGERFRSCVERLDVVDAWPVLEPPAIVPVAADAPRLLLVDDVAPRSLARVLALLREEDTECRCLTLFNAMASGCEYETRAAAGAADIAAALTESSLVVIPESRHPEESRRWMRTALAFGRRVSLVKTSGEIEHVERPAETTWAAIAHATLSGGKKRALAASFEEDVEKPSIGI